MAFSYMIFLVLKIRVKIKENLDIEKNALKTEPSAQVQKCHISAISYFSLRNESILRKFVENCRPFSNIMATLTDI